MRQRRSDRIVAWAAFLAAPALVVAAADPAGAQERAWRRSSASPGAAAFIDTRSIRREGDRVRFDRELRFDPPRTFSNGAPFDRILAREEGDCKARTLREGAMTVRLGDKVVVQFSSKGKTEAVVPDSNADIDLQAACFGKWSDSG